MSINPDLVRARCQEIETSVARLTQFQSFTREEFLADQDTLDVACYRLLIAIEAALALCFLISAKRLQKAPEEYAGCFRLLHEAGLISSDLTIRLQRIARFRNLLVHVYWRIDYGQVYDVIQSHLDDLRNFSSTIARLL